MKLLRFAPVLILPLLLASCGSVELAPTHAPSIVLAQDATRTCGQGEIVFPAGEYKAEVTSAEGTYYKAPKRIRTLGVLIGRSEDGGIFVSNSAGNPQAAWFGEPKANVGESPDTLFGAIGWSAPKLWPYTPRIPHTVKK
jgi:hypothetical protein